MSGASRRGIVLLAAALLVATGAPALAATTTQDPSRNGWVPDEPGLSPAAVGADTFGQRFSAPVDGQVFASPVVDDGTLVVATETNHVYGLDAEDGSRLWARAFGPPFDADAAPVACSDLKPSVVITGTPALDATSHTAYFVSKESTSGPGEPQSARMLMHALDTRNGDELPGWPVTLDGAADNDPGVTFDAT